MANFNTFSGFRGGTGRNQIPLQTLAAVTETAFTVNTDNGVGATAILAVPAGNGIAGSVNPFDQNVNASILLQNSSLQLSRGVGRPEFSAASFSGLPFRVRVTGVGTATAGALAGITIKIYCGTTANIGTAANTFSSTGAIATVAGGSFNFMAEATCIWDATSGLLGGFSQAEANFGAVSTYVAPAASTTAPLAVAAVTGLTFFATAKWSTTAGGTVQVNEFSMERV